MHSILFLFFILLRDSGVVVHVERSQHYQCQTVCALGTAPASQMSGGEGGGGTVPSSAKQGERHC